MGHLARATMLRESSSMVSMDSTGSGSMASTGSTNATVSTLWWARAYASLTQAELGEAVGASRETISSIERGRSIPSVTLAIAIARRLDVDVEMLFSVD
jgi:putative transcriptional regulator